jgi:FecR protein
VSDLRYLRLATTVLRRQSLPLPPASLGDRAVTVAALEQALRGRARRRVWQRVSVGAAAAAVLAVTWGWVLHRPPSPIVELAPPRVAPPPTVLTATARPGHGDGATILRGTTAVALHESVPLKAGDRLAVPRGAGVAVSLSTGTELGLTGNGTLSLVQLDAMQRFRLPSGTLNAKVHPLETGQRFIINTADAEVEVKGTQFEVSILERPACADGTRTRVEVFEGVVTVTRPGGQPVYVAAGSDWPRNCRPPAGAVVVARKSFSRHARLGLETDLRPTTKTTSRRAPARPAEAAPPADPFADIVLPPPSSTASSAPTAAFHPPSRIVRPPASSLVVENDLYEEALKAIKDGDRAKALRRIDELLTRFPDGVMAESAQLERRKLKADRGAPPRPSLDPFEH